MTDIMAREAFRSALADIIDREAERVYEGGASVDVDAVVNEVLDRFGDVHYEHRTNEYGVPVMRLVITGEEVVDLTEVAERQRQLSAQTVAHPFEDDGEGDCAKILSESLADGGFKLSFCGLAASDSAHAKPVALACGCTSCGEPSVPADHLCTLV